MKCAKDIFANRELFRQSLVGIQHQPKCYGIAKNFMTNALKADPNTPLPKYPWIFAKPFSCLKPKGQDFKIPWHSEESAVVHEVELGVIFNDVPRS